MNARSKQLLQEVLGLPPEERDAFAATLLENLDSAPDTRTDAEWATELERRMQEALQSDWKGHTWEEVRADVERSLQELRGER